jgi:hypothetical protein
MVGKKIGEFALLKRRDFLALATASVASVATGWTGGRGLAAAMPGTAAEEAVAVDMGGIATEYFEAARKRAAEMVAESVPVLS